VRYSRKKEELFMVAGHLRIKNDKYQIVLNYQDVNGKRKTKWQSTGLPAKGNKKRAEEMLLEARMSFTPPGKIDEDNLFFTDYLLQYLDVYEPTVRRITFQGYRNCMKNTIIPYFKPLKLKLTEINQRHLQEFYSKQLKRVKASTVIHYHAFLHKALKHAFQMDLILFNPADKVQRPRKEAFVGKFYSREESQKLFALVKGTKLEIPVAFGCFYGLRRSEVLGLRWGAIDFESNCFIINHTVTEGRSGGKYVRFFEDNTKTKSSCRTLPLIPEIKEWLLEIKAAHDENRRICGDGYNPNFVDYLCVDELGNLLRGNYISERFSKLLKANGMREIRFHDLRHTCASILISMGLSMKQIQEWLGHSDYNTTANIYAHLDPSSKNESAIVMAAGFGIQEIMPMSTTQIRTGGEVHA